MDGLIIAALYLAAQNLPAGIRPQISVEDIVSDLAFDQHFEGDSEAQLDAQQGAQVVIGKATGAVGQPGADYTAFNSFALRFRVKWDRIGQIISGLKIFAEFRQDREIK